MIQNLNQSIHGLQSAANTVGGPDRSAGQNGGFAEVLQKTVGDVAQLQRDAQHAVEGLASGQTDDVTGVMLAVEKSDLAFNTLLAVRKKLMDAFEEIRNMPV
ncbi:MAG: flagellar hook-basal body complex protein FliE [Planctomycetota bacterium]